MIKSHFLLLFLVFSFSYFNANAFSSDPGVFICSDLKSGKVEKAPCSLSSEDQAVYWDDPQQKFIKESISTDQLQKLGGTEGRFRLGDFTTEISILTKLTKTLISDIHTQTKPS